MTVGTFRHTIYDYYRRYRRDLPWRYERDPYKILISEVMLQQTQISRVLIKYPQFIQRFPTCRSLADASLPDVLSVWQGMGYNRRAKYLKEAAIIIVHDCRYRCMVNTKHASSLPINDAEQLVSLLRELPGIGHATGCAIITYAFDLPTLFIETNIRAVFLYHFGKGKQRVSDRELLPFVKKTLDKHNPREWYYALTDYGAMLKTREKFTNVQSRHYVKQTRFEGSRRQLRGNIVKALIHSPRPIGVLARESGRRRREVLSVLQDLAAERFVERRGSQWRLSE